MSPVSSRNRPRCNYWATCCRPGIVPEILHEDEANCCLVMTALPANHLVLKQAMLEGNIRLDFAPQLAELLAQVHIRNQADAQQLATAQSHRLAVTRTPLLR